MDEMYQSSRPQLVARNALSVLWIFVLVCVATAIVGLRGSEVGTDTAAYAEFFVRYTATDVVTRFEPGFLWIVKSVGSVGGGVQAFQIVLFCTLVVTVLIATREYFFHIGGAAGYAKFFTAAIALLFISPVFTSAATNGIRQGLSALPVFAALIAFREKNFVKFICYGLVAASFHYSALLYLVFAPVLLLPARVIGVVTFGAFIAYCSGGSLLFVEIFAPPVYSFVMNYGVHADYDSGVRFDFAFFSIFWFVLPYAASRFVQSPYNDRVERSAALYAVMLLPFFAVGWGNFSNRYLFSAWLAIPIMGAAILVYSKLSLFRNRLFLGFFALVATIVFSLYLDGSFLA